MAAISLRKPRKWRNASEPEPPLQVVLKVASRCNLACSYCYVYKKGDDSWRDRPSIMPDRVYEAALERTRRHCQRSRQPSVTLTFHGGEPCLLGAERFDAWCRRAITVLGATVRVRFCLQTNGTLLNETWADLIKTHDVNIAVSLDGPKDVHDAARVDHGGRGSYDAVRKGIQYLQSANIPLQVLSVIQFGADSVRVHQHFVDLGARAINYLFPDFTHDTIADIRHRHGRTPCADFLIPVLDHWWSYETLDVRIILFWEIARLILGGENELDLFGNRPFGFVFVEADGTIEALDVLKVCRPGLPRTPLNVLRNDFLDLRSVSPLHRASILTGVPLPQACRGCREETTCAGGYLPHRFSGARGFDNPTVWCADILRLFDHMRTKLDVSNSDTLMRRRVLAELNAEAQLA
jgi:uncharacterized protein